MNLPRTHTNMHAYTLCECTLPGDSPILTMNLLAQLRGTGPMALRLLEENIVAESALKRWDMLQRHVVEIRNGLLVAPGDQQARDRQEGPVLPISSQPEMLAAEAADGIREDLEEEEDGESEVGRRKGDEESGDEEEIMGQGTGGGWRAGGCRQGEARADLSNESLAASDSTGGSSTRSTSLLSLADQASALVMEMLNSRNDSGVQAANCTALCSLIVPGGSGRI